MYENLQPAEVAKQWESYGGATKWSIGLRKLQGKALVDWWGGMPQCASAIPLCFVIRFPDGTEFNGSRLKDIQAAIAKAEPK